MKICSVKKYTKYFVQGKIARPFSQSWKFFTIAIFNFFKVFFNHSPKSRFKNGHRRLLFHFIVKIVDWGISQSCRIFEKDISTSARLSFVDRSFRKQIFYEIARLFSQSRLQLFQSTFSLELQ